MEIRRGVASMALAAAGLAGAGGAWMLAPAVVGAQEDDPTTDTQAPAEGEGRPEGGPCRGPGRGRAIEPAAAAIGIEADALRESLQGGQTMAEVAQANGVDPQAVVDALVADATEHINQKVADGDITQAEADEKLAELPERMTAIVNGERPERPEGAPDGGPDEEPAEDAESTEGS